MSLRFWAMVAVLFSIVMSPMASANWPDNRPVRMVVAFPPGGPADTIARLLATELQNELGGTFIVENRPGAGATIGTAHVAKGKPDGYTLILTSAVAQSVNPTLMPHVAYDPVGDFTHISLIARGPVAIMVNAKSPYSTLDDLINASKDRSMFFGAATGSVGHLTGEMTRRIVDFDLQHIPYKGTGPAMVDLLGDHIDVVTDVLTAHMGNIKAGNVRVLAVAADERLSSVPDAPTFVEQGYRDLVAYSWFGLSGPRNMPQDIVEKLAAATQKTLAKPEFAQLIEELGMEATHGYGTQRYTRFAADEVEKWAAVIRAENITAN